MITDFQYSTRRKSLQSSDPHEENAELGAAVTVRIKHVKSLRIFAADNAVEMGPHVGKLAVILVGVVGRKNAGAHGDRVEMLEDVEIGLVGFAALRVADPTSVDEGAPKPLF